MAEGLAVASGSAGIVSLGIQIGEGIKKVYDLYGRFKDAPNQNIFAPRRSGQPRECARRVSDAAQARMNYILNHFVVPSGCNQRLCRSTPGTRNFGADSGR